MSGALHHIADDPGRVSLLAHGPIFLMEEEISEVMPATKDMQLIEPVVQLLENRLLKLDRSDRLSAQQKTTKSYLEPIPNHWVFLSVLLEHQWREKKQREIANLSPAKRH
ncbi:MAG: hypothetical protein PVG14_06810 [Anaerolineales bacterium]